MHCIIYYYFIQNEGMRAILGFTMDTSAVDMHHVIDLPPASLPASMSTWKLPLKKSPSTTFQKMEGLNDKEKEKQWSEKARQ